MSHKRHIKPPERKFPVPIHTSSSQQNPNSSPLFETTTQPCFGSCHSPHYRRTDPFKGLLQTPDCFCPSKAAQKLIKMNSGGLCGAELTCIFCMATLMACSAVICMLWVTPPPLLRVLVWVSSTAWLNLARPFISRTMSLAMAPSHSQESPSVIIPRQKAILSYS